MDDGTDVIIRWVRFRKSGQIAYGTMTSDKRFVGKWHARIGGASKTCCGKHDDYPSRVAAGTIVPADTKGHRCKRCWKAVVTLHKAMSAMSC